MIGRRKPHIIDKKKIFTKDDALLQPFLQRDVDDLSGATRHKIFEDGTLPEVINYNIVFGLIISLVISYQQTSLTMNIARPISHLVFLARLNREGVFVFPRLDLVLLGYMIVFTFP